MTDQDDPKKLNIVFEQKFHPTLTLNDLEPKTSIADLKNKIYHHTGFVKDKMELKFDGKIMEDSKTLADYHVPNNSQVNFKGFDAMSQRMV